MLNRSPALSRNLAAGHSKKLRLWGGTHALQKYKKLTTNSQGAEQHGKKVYTPLQKINYFQKLSRVKQSYLENNYRNLIFSKSSRIFLNCTYTIWYKLRIKLNINRALWKNQRHTTHDMKVNNIQLSRPQIIQHNDHTTTHTR